MKISELLLLVGFAAAALVPGRHRDPQDSGQEGPGKKAHPITAFPKQEAERLAKEIEGSWILMGYDDPIEVIDDGALDGFATFLDGFMTLMIQAHALETRFLSRQEVLVVEAGAYRYRFDEMANLQTASVMGFSNMTDDGELLPDRAGMTGEYLATIADGLLELRSADGSLMTFRRVEAGDFPESAIRALERQRGGVNAWDDQTDGRDD